MDTYPHAENVDKELPQYIPPENVLELGSNQNVRVKLTRDNYKERMHYLLYLEEHEHKKIMSRYFFYSIKYAYRKKICLFRPCAHGRNFCFPNFLLMLMIAYMYRAYDKLV